MCLEYFLSNIKHSIKNVQCNRKKNLSHSNIFSREPQELFHCFSRLVFKHHLKLLRAQSPLAQGLQHWMIKSSDIWTFIDKWGKETLTRLTLLVLRHSFYCIRSQKIVCSRGCSLRVFSAKIRLCSFCDYSGRTKFKFTNSVRWCSNILNFTQLLQLKSMVLPSDSCKIILLKFKQSFVL